MDNMILNLLALVSFILVIKYIWYPIMLSVFRDKMFNNRLKYRNYFYDNKLDMNSIAYKSTYDYINNIIRYVEDYSFIDMMYKLYLLNKHKIILEEIQDKTENELSELSEKDKEFVLKLRQEISDYLFFHILRTSIFAIICIIFVIGYMIIGTIFKKFRKPKDFWTSEKLSFIVSN